MATVAEPQPMVTLPKVDGTNGVMNDDASDHGAVGIVDGDDQDLQAEAEDAFPTGNNDDDIMVPIVDRESLAMIERSSRPGPPSVATTALASAVGSVVGPSRDACLKSITFLKDQETDMNWGVTFMDANLSGSKKSGFGIFRRRQQQRLVVENVQGLFALSKFHEGDVLKSINGKKIHLSSAEDTETVVTEQMKHVLDTDGFLSVEVSNKEDGDDILIQATIIKPRPDLTYEDMGMVVWFWGYLCIKSISKESIWRRTALKSTDHIVQVNDIQCDKLSAEQFAQIINELPLDITITVLRRKQRASGRFG